MIRFRAFHPGVIVKRVYAAFFIMLAWGVLVVAQSNLGGLSGTVTDQNGAVFPNAAVTIINVGTNRTITLTTSDEGVFRATLLEPVTYRVTVEAPGFKRALVESVKVDTATTTTTDVTLETGAPTETVTVTDDAPLINTESGETGQTINERQILDAPLNNRSVLDLALTAPNVTGDAVSEDPQIFQSPTSPGSGLNVNGGRPGSTAILADGVNNTAVGLSRALVTFSPDVVQEFKVSTSAFSAEFGQTGGGVINATTKGGGNRFGGTLYAFHRNPKTNAAPFDTNIVNRATSLRRQTNLGLILSGPVYLPRFGEGGPRLYNGKDRTFFFFAFEPRRSYDGFPSESLLPAAEFRRGDFSDAVFVNGGVTTRAIAGRFNIPITGAVTLYDQFGAPVNGQFLRSNRRTPVANVLYPRFTNNIIPQSYLDPVAQRILEFLPAPSDGDYFVSAVGQLRNVRSNRDVTNEEDRLTLRFDHQITDANKANFRFTRVPIFGERTFGLPNNVVTLASEFSASKQLLFGDTHIFSPSVVNDLRLSYTKGDFSQTDSQEFLTRSLARELGLPAIADAGLPRFQFGGGFNVGNNSIGQIGRNIEEGFNIVDTLSYTRGNMTMKFGADLRHQRLRSQRIAEAAGGDYNFTAQLTNNNGLGNGADGLQLASFLLGLPQNVNLRGAVIPYYYRWNSGAIFYQNDWKVRPNLTINLGARYVLQQPRTEKFDRQGTIDLALSETRTLTADERVRIATGLSFTGITATIIPAQIPTTTLIPVFAFAGRGERSRYLTPLDKNDFEPRFGFSYAPKF
ncbi:MAG: carboxypeptidase regulatory-like domain-containing protein [Acidobacteriota bacterium]|nr:carboxypeptidase regulatory-like domain-containing protein [Acidobacteriota bacterium]